MVEWLVAKLGYSPLFRRVFSTLPRLAAESDPAVQRRILVQAEKKVYGESGLEVYERDGHSELECCARRALAQHFCQRALRDSWVVNFIRDVLAALACLSLMVLFGVAGSYFRERAEGPRPDLVVFFWYERLYKFVEPEAFPERTFRLHRGHQVYLAGREWWFLLRAVVACPRLLGYPVLLCNLVRWLGYYGFVIHHYRPKRAVVHFCESVASASLITAYLHENGLAHIDVQHGEVRFMVHSAFCHFDEIRVWGEHFRNVVLLNRSPEQDIQVVGVPHYRALFAGVRSRLQPRPPRLLILDPFLYQDVSLYSSLIRSLLERLDSAWEVRVRRHPAELRKTLEWMEALNASPELEAAGVQMSEEPPSVPIEDALAISRIVLGVASGAMIEAWIAGCKVIHLAGGPYPEALMARYQNSANVLYLDANCQPEVLNHFLSTPALLSRHEAELVNYVVKVAEQAA